MKTNYNIKDLHSRGFKGVMGVLSLLFALTLFAGTAFAEQTTYYLLKSYNDHKPTSMSSAGYVTAEDVFQWKISAAAGETSNFYFALSTSSSYVDMYPNSSAYSQADIVLNTEKISAYGTQDCYVGSTRYYFYRFAKNTSDAETFYITYQKSTGKYTISDEAGSCTMSIKHAWGGGSQSWQNLTDAGNNVYTYSGEYGGSAICQISNDGGTNYTQYTATLYGSPSEGDDCTFTFTSTGLCATASGTMSITKNSEAGYFVAGNGTASGLSNWCDGKSWDADGSAMTGSPASITFSGVITTSDKPLFKVTNGKWSESGGTEYAYSAWDGDYTDFDDKTITVESEGSNSNIKINLKTNEAKNITITFNPSPTVAGKYIHIKCVNPSTAPEIYIAEYPEKSGNILNGHIFLAQTGGAAITDIKVYYAKGADPVIGESDYVTISGDNFVCGQKYAFSIEDICSIGSGDYHIQAVATNSTGAGNSDIVTYKNFECCAGSITSLKIEPTAVAVLPGESYGFKTTIEGGGAEPTYQWWVKINDGAWAEQVSTAADMYYLVPTSANAGDKIYAKVTVTGSNCSDTKTVTSTMTVCNTPSITSLEAESSVSAWTALNVTCAIGTADSFEWSVSPDAELTEASSTGVTFKGGTSQTASTDYTITLTVKENTCGSSVSQSVDVTVNPDKDICD